MSISPFFVRCLRCCFVMSVIVNLLLALMRVHQPIFVRCPRCSFVLSVVINLLLALMRVHQPVSRPMSTVLLCHIVGYQLVAFCPACPSAHFLSDVHEARLCDNRVVYGLLRIEHTTHAIQPSGEITSLKPSVQLS